MPTLSEYSIKLLQAATNGDGNRIKRTAGKTSWHLEVENTDISTTTTRLQSMYKEAFDQLLGLKYIEHRGNLQSTGTSVTSIYVATAKGFNYADSLPK